MRTKAAKAAMAITGSAAALVFASGFAAKRYGRVARQSLRKAQAESSAKSNFLANISHEMRTPLNAVVGLSELMLSTGGFCGEVEDRLDKIHASGLTLLGIVNDILDISKIESGKFTMHPVEYGTPDLINDIVSQNIMRIGGKPINFKLSVDENLPMWVIGDDLRVKQIFNNLLSNAFKYTKSGSVEWDMAFERDGGSVWFISSVKDTGIGIKDEDVHKLFLDYSQVDAATSRKAEGTGLGLAITKRMLDMMDGVISVESEYGKGTTFNVRLRQKFVSSAAIGKEVANELANTHFIAARRVQSGLEYMDLSFARVLVVDDVQANLDVIMGMLKPYGISVDCALGGGQSVEMVLGGGHKYDIIFMDHVMPGIDGIAALRAIRDGCTNYARDVPVVVLTANAMSGNEKMFIDSGFQAFISKPIDRVRLDEILRRLIGGKGHAMWQEGLGRQFFGAIEASGVDIATGLKCFEGNVETYAKVLQSYAASTRPLLEAMRGHLREWNLHEYIIAAHGVKGSSYGIGAMAAGQFAERLEQAAKAGGQGKLQVNNDLFTEYMEDLLDSVDAALANGGYFFNCNKTVTKK